jgi:hypothetical protein
MCAHKCMQGLRIVLNTHYTNPTWCTQHAVGFMTPAQDAQEAKMACLNQSHAFQSSGKGGMSYANAVLGINGLGHQHGSTTQKDASRKRAQECVTKTWMTPPTKQIQLVARPETKVAACVTRRTLALADGRTKQQLAFHTSLPQGPPQWQHPASGLC